VAREVKLFCGKTLRRYEQRLFFVSRGKLCNAYHFRECTLFSLTSVEIIGILARFFAILTSSFFTVQSSYAH